MAVLKQAPIFGATGGSLKLFDLMPGFAGCSQVLRGSFSCSSCWSAAFVEGGVAFWGERMRWVVVLVVDTLSQSLPISPCRRLRSGHLSSRLWSRLGLLWTFLPNCHFLAGFAPGPFTHVSMGLAGGLGQIVTSGSTRPSCSERGDPVNFDN